VVKLWQAHNSLLLLLLQEERQAAATALVAALVYSQKAYDATHRAKSAQPAGSFDQEAGNRQQRMEECLSCCSPLMVSLPPVSCCICLLEACWQLSVKKHEPFENI
jgi:hypothetical protein